MHRRLSLRTAKLAALSLILLAAGGATYQALALRAEEQRADRPRHMVRTNGFLINLYCTGKGSPTVVLESGLGDSLETWRRVQPGIERFTRVCSYDRAGHGYSEAGPMPRTSDRIASELHAALTAAGEKPPYLLVGHSLGGFHVRVFHGKYRSEVAAMVLVDSTQEDQYHLLPKSWDDLAAATRVRARRQLFWAPVYIGLGIARLELLMRGREAPPLLLQSKYLQARASELLHIRESAEQARMAGSLDDKPLLVLTAGKAIDAALKAALSPQDQQRFADVWIHTLQLRLAGLSRRGRQVMVEDSGHDMPNERPDAVVAAVRELSERE